MYHIQLLPTLIFTHISEYTHFRSKIITFPHPFAPKTLYKVSVVVSTKGFFIENLLWNYLMLHNHFFVKYFLFPQLGTLHSACWREEGGSQWHSAICHGSLLSSSCEGRCSRHSWLGYAYERCSSKCYRDSRWDNPVSFREDGGSKKWMHSLKCIDRSECKYS